MWSGNAVRESSHLSFFCGRDTFCEVVGRPKNTHGEPKGLLDDQRTSPLRFGDQRISAFSPKLQTLYCLSSPIRKYEHTHVFSVYSWLSELTYSPFCWSYLRTEISVILSIGNKIYFCHHLYFLFPVKPLCWCYLATALNLLSSSTKLWR